MIPILINGLLVFTLTLGCQTWRSQERSDLILDQKIKVDNLIREFDIFQPQNLNLQTKYPLIISLHGHRGSKEYNAGYTGKKSPHKVFKEVGEREKFFVVYPQGEKGNDNFRGWNGCRADAKTNPVSNDTQFISLLIDYMIQNYPVDTKKVYVVGTSNGGEMAERLAIEIPNKITAAAVIAFSSSSISECKQPTQPISMLFMNGTKDPLTPYEGGTVANKKSERGTVKSVKDTLAYWLTVNGITQLKPDITKITHLDKSDNTSVEVLSYRGGKNDTEVVHYKIIDGGHVEPSIKEQMGWIYLKIVGQQNKDIETAEIVWNFFKTKNKN